MCTGRRKDAVPQEFRNVEGVWPLLLVLDIGNTNITAGIYDGRGLLHHWRLPTARELTADALAVQMQGLLALHGIALGDLEGPAVSCVVPALVAPVTEMARRYLGAEPLFVGPDTDTGITIAYRRPQEVGADRIVNAAAAYARWGGPVIVVDFGTATTVDAVSDRGEYLGGAIAPGVAISVAALFRQAALLPRIELAPPARAIGGDTVSSMQSGIVFGFAGQVDALVRRIAAEMGGRPRVIATGGLASLIAPACETLDALEPNLTLDGLRLVYERARKR